MQNKHRVYKWCYQSDTPTKRRSPKHLSLVELSLVETEIEWRKFFWGKAFEILKFELWVGSEDLREMSQQVIGFKSWFSSSHTIKRQVVKVYRTHVNKCNKLYIYANAFYSVSSLNFVATFCFYNRCSSLWHTR
jgi:hypothetical protein